MEVSEFRVASLFGAVVLGSGGDGVALDLDGGRITRQEVGDLVLAAGQVVDGDVKLLELEEQASKALFRLFVRFEICKRLVVGEDDETVAVKIMREVLRGPNDSQRLLVRHCVLELGWIELAAGVGDRVWSVFKLLEKDGCNGGQEASVWTMKSRP